MRIVITEEQLKRIVSDQIGEANIPTNLNKFKSSPLTSIGGTPKLPVLNMNDPIHFNTYVRIANDFIRTRPSNLLGITGQMLAYAAKETQNKFKKYVPLELSLAQLAQEGGFSSDKNARPIKTKNPFNVGNVDSGKNTYSGSVMSGIQKYYDLMATKYLGAGKNVNDLIRNFTNGAGNRYASDKNYEVGVAKISDQVKQISQPKYNELYQKGHLGFLNNIA